MIFSRFAALAVISLLWSGYAAAGFLRYEVTMAGDPDAYGHMLFEDPVNDGNIMPYLVDWLFHDPSFGGLTYDSTNAVAGVTNEFIVDVQGSYVSDNILCFGIDNACEGAIAKGEVLMSGSGGIAIFVHPGGTPIVSYGRPSFSPPISVQLPGSQLMIGIGLIVLMLTRRLENRRFAIRTA